MDNLDRQLGVASAGFSITVQIKLENKPGTFARVVHYLGEARASLAEVTLIYNDFNYLIREITINCPSEKRAQQVLLDLPQLQDIELLSWRDDTFELHKGGKLEVQAKAAIHTTDELSRAYTPGVARICNAISEDPSSAYDLTMKSNTIAVVTDGTAVLGLGDIGPLAALPVMEGKAVLFKQFGGLNAFPLCLQVEDTEQLIQSIKSLSPGFAGINLEDIAAPRCFEVEDRLRQELDIPVFHDDQHGTAVVVLAGIMNALKIVGKRLESIKIVVNGFGAGGVACTRMLLLAGVKNIIPCDKAGTVYEGRRERMNPVKEELSKQTNPERIQGSLQDAMKGADVFIGVSRPGVLTPRMVQSMAKDPIVFALANPVPEIMPEEIIDIARIIATGRSDFANQVNNVLCFPGIFKGAVACRARDITENMRLAAAYAIANVIQPEELHERYIIPSVFHGDVAERVAAAVIAAAQSDGVARP